MFEEQTVDNLKQCLTAMMVHIFPNKVYKLQKWYIWHMTYKPRHISAHKWIARMIKLNSYLLEFPMPPRIEPRKTDQDEILEVLENGIPTLWKFQMDEGGFNASSSTITEFTKMCICKKEWELAIPEMLVAAHKSPFEREGKYKSKFKAEESYHK
eukprot:6943535-Ditylum_brightwellii.AAC.2